MISMLYEADFSNYPCSVRPVVAGMFNFAAFGFVAMAFLGRAWLVGDRMKWRIIVSIGVVSLGAFVGVVARSTTHVSVQSGQLVWTGCKIRTPYEYRQPLSQAQALVTVEHSGRTPRFKLVIPFPEEGHPLKIWLDDNVHLENLIYFFPVQMENYKRLLLRYGEDVPMELDQI